MAEFLHKKALTFDDVHLVPQYSDIESRKKDIDLSVRLNNSDIVLKAPFIASPMDTVSGYEMAIAIQNEAGGLAILHRYCSIEEQTDSVRRVIAAGANVGAAIGINGDYLERADAVVQAGAKIICVDVAHGHHSLMRLALTKLRDRFPKIHIMAGNVATLAGFNALSDWGADSVRLGVGSGCLAGDTMILMSDGTYKEIHKINVHDRVINMHGQPVSVVSVRYSGRKSIARVKHNIWYKDTIATQDHTFFVGSYALCKDVHKVCLSKWLDKNHDSYIWEAIGAAKNNAALLMPRNINFELQDTFSFSLSNYAESYRNMSGYIDLDKPIHASYDLGYIIGTFLGDGHSSVIRNTRNGNRRNTSAMCYWTFGINEMDIAEKLSKCIKDVFDADTRISRTINTIRVHTRRNILSRFFLIFGKRTKKHLPKEFMCKDIHYNEGLLDGLLDSDGHYGADGRNTLSNTSEYILQQFMLSHFIAKGYWPSAMPKPRTIGGLINANIDNISQAYAIRTVNRPETYLTEKYNISRLQDYRTEDEMVDTYDIEVDCPTHSFIANNAIVHNSICSTRTQTGHGYPMLQNILDVTMSDRQTQLISDGGIRQHGDIVKAIAAGANLVMMGSMFAGTDEAPGQLIETEHGLKKTYRGMASKESQIDWRGHHSSNEGISTTVPYKGSVKDILIDMASAVASGFSYSGARNQQELREKAVFAEVSSASAMEATTHILGR